MATLLPGRYFSLVRNSPDASTKLSCQVQCAPAVQSSVVGSLVEETLPWDGTAPPPPHNGFDPQLPAEMTPSCHRHLSLISINVDHQHHLTSLILHQLQSFVLPSSSDWQLSVDDKHTSFQGKCHTNTSHPHSALPACNQTETPG